MTTTVPPKAKITILDDADIRRMLHKIDDLYVYLADLLINHRGYNFSLPPRTPSPEVVPLRGPSPRGPWAKGPDERGRP